MPSKKTSRPLPFQTPSARVRESRSASDAIRQAHRAMDAFDDFCIVDDTWHAKLGRQVRRALRNLLWSLLPMLQVTLILLFNLLAYLAFSFFMFGL